MLLACRAAIGGGLSTLVFEKKDHSVTLKSDMSPVTAADYESHARIMEVLSGSGLPIVSEEGQGFSYEERKDWDSFWLVDPLDGTKEFIKGNGEYSVNIALIESDIPIIGVIYIPVKDLLFAAVGTEIYKLETASKSIEDMSLALDEFRLTPDVNKDYSRIRVLTSRSHISEATKEYIRLLEEKYERVEIIPAGSALKFTLLAEGKADIYPRFGPTMEWDIAAGHVLLKAVGKNIYDYRSGREHQYNKTSLKNDWFLAQ